MRLRKEAWLDSSTIPTSQTLLSGDGGQTEDSVFIFCAGLEGAEKGEEITMLYHGDQLSFPCYCDVCWELIPEEDRTSKQNKKTVPF